MKKAKRWMRILCLTLVMVLMAGMLSGCTLRSVGLVAAALKSFNEYKDEWASRPLASLSLGENGAFGAELGLGVVSLPDMPALEGFGLRLGFDSNGAEEELGLRITPEYLGECLAEPVLFLKGSELCLNIPEIMGNSAYKFDLKNLGDFLCRMDLLDNELRDLGFNPFEIINILRQSGSVDGQALENYKNLCLDQLEEIGVEGPVRRMMDVNENELDCQVYTVIIPAGVLEEQVNALFDLYNEAGGETYEKLFRALGFNQQITDILVAEVKSQTGDKDEIRQEILAFTQQLRDLKVEVAVSGGYLVAARTAFEVDGDEFALIIELGGGENYLEDATVKLVDEYNDGIALELNSYRSNSLYRSHGTLYAISEGRRMPVAFTKTVYDSEKTGENYSFTCEIDNGYETYIADIRGCLSGEAERLSFKDGVLELLVDDYCLARGSVELAIGPHSDSMSIDPASAIDLSRMNLAEIEKELYSLLGSAEDWILSVAGILGDKLYYLM